jgi:histidinol dehydrogenase
LENRTDYLSKKIEKNTATQSLRAQLQSNAMSKLLETTEEQMTDENRIENFGALTIKHKNENRVLASLTSAGLIFVGAVAEGTLVGVLGAVPIALGTAYINHVLLER